MARNNSTPSVIDGTNSPNLGASSGENFFDANMSTLLYASAGAIIVICVFIHGCIFYRRWRRRRRTTSGEDKETGWSSKKMVDKAKVAGSSHENSVVSCSAESDQQSRSDSIKLLQEAKSSTKSLLDQDLNERRRSSSIRIKVLPPPVIIQSTSGPIQSTQRPSEESHHEDFKRGSDPQPAKVALIAELAGLESQKNPKVYIADGSDASRPSYNTGKIPNDVNSSCYEQICSSTSNIGSVPKANNLDRSQSGSNRSVPAIIQTQPSEEKYDHLEPRDPIKRATVTRQNKNNPDVNKQKRRSYSFDNAPAFEASPDLKPHWNTLGLVRNRSASESRPVPKSVKLQLGTSNPDPVYFTLEPGPDIDPHSRNDKGYRTLPPNKTAEQPTGPIKRKFTINALFSRKSRKTEKKKDKYGTQTPPSSPGKSSIDQNQQAIYEEPKGVQGSDQSDLQEYSTVNPDNQVSVGEDRGEKSESRSPSKSKPSFLNPFHKSRSKSKSFSTKTTPRKGPTRNVCDDLNDAYEVLQIPMGALATTGGPVYDTPETDLPSNQAASKKLPVIGTTSTGAPLKQYRSDSARRELPNPPNEYDVIERGAFPPLRSVSRSKSARPNPRSDSTKPPVKYDIPMVPDRLRAIDLSRRSSSPETARHDSNQVYDMLNPITMVMQRSTDIKQEKPGVGPKPNSLRGLPRGSEYELLYSGRLSRHGSFLDRPKPKLAPRPLLRSNSLGKLRKVSPEISPKPSQNRNIKSSKPSKGKPVISPKPSPSQEAKTPDPVYFTLDPNSTPETK